MNEWMNLWIILTVLTEFLLFLLSFTVLSFTHLILLFIPLVPSFLLFFPIPPFSDLSSSPSLSLTLLSFYCSSSLLFHCFVSSSPPLPCLQKQRLSVTECSMEVQMCKFADAASFIVIVLHFLMSQLPPLCHTKAWLNVASHYHVKEPASSWAADWQLISSE